LYALGKALVFDITKRPLTTDCTAIHVKCLSNVPHIRFDSRSRDISFRHCVCSPRLLNAPTIFR